MQRSGNVAGLKDDIYSREGGEKHPLKDGREEPSVTIILAENRAASWRELGFVLLALASVTAMFLYLSDGWILFVRPLWTDELHTVLVASRSSPLTIFADLANGADYGPPLTELGTWVLGVLTGGLTNANLRVASMLCVWGALLLLYSTLRRRFDAAPSLAAVAAVASHSLVVAHSFEARFYGPWLLCASYLAWSFTVPAGRRRDVNVAVASVLLATVHWYGVVSLGIMCAGAVAACGARWRDALRLLRPALAGLLAFALCVPLAVGQRHALTVNTWVPEFRLSQLESLARIYWASLIPMLALLLFVVAALVQTRRGEPGRVVRLAVAIEDPGLVALVALATMPLALAAMSIAGQPSMWPRYAIPAVLAWAPLIALAVSLAGRWPTRAFVAVALATWFVSVTRESQYKSAFAVGVSRQLAAIQQARALGVPIVFQSMHAMYASASGDWDRRLSTSFLEIPDSTMDAVLPRAGRFESLNKNLRVERDVARVHSRRFGFPRLSSQQSLDSLRRFVLVASDDNMPAGFSGVEGIVVAVFPHHRMARLAPGMLLLERQ